MKISMSESKNTSIFFIATSSFGFLPVTAWQKRAPAPLVETSCKMWRSSAGHVQFCVSWKGSTSTKWTYCTNSERHFSTPPFLSFQNCGSVQWSERQSEKLKVWCGAWTRTKSLSVVNQGHCCLNFWVFGGKDHKTECKWEPVWTLGGGLEGSDESEHTLPPCCDLIFGKANTHIHTGAGWEQIFKSISSGTSWRVRFWHRWSLITDLGARCELVLICLHPTMIKISNCQQTNIKEETNCPSYI